MGRLKGVLGVGIVHSPTHALDANDQALAFYAAFSWRPLRFLAFFAPLPLAAFFIDAWRRRWLRRKEPFLKVVASWSTYSSKCLRATKGVVRLPSSKVRVPCSSRR